MLRVVLVACSRPCIKTLDAGYAAVINTQDAMPGISRKPSAIWHTSTAAHVLWQCYVQSRCPTSYSLSAAVVTFAGTCAQI